MIHVNRERFKSHRKMQRRIKSHLKRHNRELAMANIFGKQPSKHFLDAQNYTRILNKSDLQTRCAF